MVWQSFLGSQEAGMGKSRVRVVQVGEVQGTGEYDVDRTGSNTDLNFGSFLQWSHESSLPVSNTMVTGCGGVPTRRETERVTLWRKGSLLADLGPDPDGICWVLRANMTEAEEFELWVPCFD